MLRPFLNMNNKQLHLSTFKALDKALNLFYLYILVAAFYRTIFCPLALYLLIPVADLVSALRLYPRLHKPSLGCKREKEEVL